jgi:hypothetical protein
LAAAATSLADPEPGESARLQTEPAIDAMKQLISSEMERTTAVTYAVPAFEVYILLHRDFFYCLLTSTFTCTHPRCSRCLSTPYSYIPFPPRVTVNVQWTDRVTTMTNTSLQLYLLEIFDGWGLSAGRRNSSMHYLGMSGIKKMGPRNTATIRMLQWLCTPLEQVVATMTCQVSAALQLAALGRTREWLISPWKMSEWMHWENQNLAYFLFSSCAAAACLYIRLMFVIHYMLMMSKTPLQ